MLSPLGKCPGQDTRNWKPEDISTAPCPFCGEEVEFWKDEEVRKCKKCGREAVNPGFDMGCAEWCAMAEACLGRKPRKK